MGPPRPSKEQPAGPAERRDLFARIRAAGSRPAEAAPPAPHEREVAALPPAVPAAAPAGKHPYLKLAFLNPYNLSLLFGSLSFAAILADPFIALAALSGEALWLLFGPESKLLQRFVWDPALARRRVEFDAKAREAFLAVLPSVDRRRVEGLVLRQDQIRRLAGQNPSFTGDLLRAELVKTSRLVDAFLELALNCARYEHYLAAIDLDALEEERRQYGEAARSSAAEDPRAQIAHKNEEIMTKRIERINEVRRYLTVAGGQLDLIENSFDLIADQIVTMQSPKELSGQLDELLDGVEAIRETARDTDKILGAIDKEL